MVMISCREEQRTHYFDNWNEIEEKNIPPPGRANSPDQKSSRLVGGFDRSGFGAGYAVVGCQCQCSMPVRKRLGVNPTNVNTSSSTIVL